MCGYFIVFLFCGEVRKDFIHVVLQSFLLRKRAGKLTDLRSMLSCCRVTVCVLCLVIIVIMEFPCNTYLFSYTDRKTDRLTGRKTDRQTDRQVNKLKHFLKASEGRGLWIWGRRY